MIDLLTGPGLTGSEVVFALPPELPEALFALPSDYLEAILGHQIAVEAPVVHYFGEGTYAREIRMPAGTLATARRYKVPHVCIVSAGVITVWEDGVEPVVYEAPYCFVAPAGARRKGYVHEDVVWTTILPNPENATDPEVVLNRCSEVPPVPPELVGLRPTEALAAFFAAFIPARERETKCLDL